MAHHTAREDWVGCVVLTHGARVHDKVISDQMFHQKSVPDADTLTRLMAERSDLKSQEVGRACEILGVRDVFFLVKTTPFFSLMKATSAHLQR